MNRRARFIIVAILVLLGVVALGIFGPNRRHDLQRFKSSLRARGEKLTLKEWPISESTSDGEEAARFTNAVNALISARYDPGALDLRRYLAPGSVLLTWKTNPVPVTAYRNVPRTWEETGKELEEFAQPLAEMRAIALNPPRSWGVRTNFFSGPQPNFVAIRRATYWFVISCLCNVHQANLEPSIDDLEALIGIAQMNRDEPTLVAQMIRIAVAGMGLKATWEALQAEGWSDRQLARLQKLWQSIDLLEVMETGLAGERVFGGEIWNLARERDVQKFWPVLYYSYTAGTNLEDRIRYSFTKYVWFPTYKLTAINDDEMFYVKLMQDSIDAIRNLRADGTWPNAKRATDDAIALLESKSSTPLRYHYWLSTLATPNFSKAIATAVHEETERRMTLVAIALKRFTLSGKPPPDRLDALVPDLLPVQPIDPMCGQPLHYRAQPNGKWTLYSVGEDGRDNGGNPSSTNNSKPDLWQGLDAVWPTPAP